jgi:hypothetical protein
LGPRRWRWCESGCVVPGEGGVSGSTMVVGDGGGLSLLWPPAWKHRGFWAAEVQAPDQVQRCQQAATGPCSRVTGPLGPACHTDHHERGPSKACLYQCTMVQGVSQQMAACQGPRGATWRCPHPAQGSLIRGAGGWSTTGEQRASCLACLRCNAGPVIGRVSSPGQRQNAVCCCIAARQIAVLASDG